MSAPPLQIEDLTMAYGPTVVQRDLNFDIKKGDIFIIMGGSGCGKSTLLKSMIGLIRPASGKILYKQRDIWDSEDDPSRSFLRSFGVLYQRGALWSARTLAENVALPLEEFSDYSPAEIQELVSLKLALVGLAGYENHLPAEISGGMQKRAALARAISLDPEILFFDEPSAGLDPITSRRLDDLILQLRDTLGATVVMVTHELASIFAIGSNGVFLDAESKTMIAQGAPREMQDNSDHPTVQEFLSRSLSEGQQNNEH